MFYQHLLWERAVGNRKEKKEMTAVNNIFIIFSFQTEIKREKDSSFRVHQEHIIRNEVVNEY